MKGYSHEINLNLKINSIPNKSDFTLRSILDSRACKYLYFFKIRKTTALVVAMKWWKSFLICATNIALNPVSKASAEIFS